MSRGLWGCGGGGKKEEKTGEKAEIFSPKTRNGVCSNKSKEGKVLLKEDTGKGNNPEERVVQGGESSFLSEKRQVKK